MPSKKLYVTHEWPLKVVFQGTRPYRCTNAEFHKIHITGRGLLNTDNWTPVIEQGEDKESGTRACFKATLKSCGIPHTTWEANATDRALWRSTCHSGLHDHEEKRCDALRDKRTRWKAIQPSTNIDTFVCHVCGRLCASWIGLHSHNQTHTNTNTD